MLCFLRYGLEVLVMKMNNFEVHGTLGGLPVKRVFKRKSSAIACAKSLVDNEVWDMKNKKIIFGNTRFAKYVLRNAE